MRFPAWSLSLAALAATLIPMAAGAQPSPANPVAVAAGLYAEGRTIDARQVLERAAGDPAATAAERADRLETLLEICARTEAAACLRERLQPYLDARGAALSPNPLLRREQARTAAYLLDYGRFTLDPPAAWAKALEGDSWRHENPANVDLYLRRQTLAADMALALGRPTDAVHAADKVLSLLATLQDGGRIRTTAATALSDSIAVLVDVGQTERAWGLLRAGAPLLAALAPHSFESAMLSLRTAQLLQAVGDIPNATKAAAAAAAGFSALQIEPAVRQGYLSRALTLETVLRSLQGDREGADRALDANPFASLYRTPGRAPASYDEVAYLTARALVGALAGRPDPVAASALAKPMTALDDPHIGPTLELYRDAGVALSAQSPEARCAGLIALADQARRVAATPTGVFGAWYRPGAVDQALIAIALLSAEFPDADPDVTFSLFQLAARSGPSFDNDALALLSRATDPLQRRSLHQALRLLARRDRFERDRLAVVSRAGGAVGPGLPSHDVGARLQLRAYADDIDRARRALPVDAGTSGADLVSLKRFQALLQPDEAALAVAPTPGGLAYLCVRSNRVFHVRRAADIARATLDERLLRDSLTLTNAPDEAQDKQFPVAAAVRLYDIFLRPFEACLQAGDRVLWLSPMASLNLPLSALLEAAPPRDGAGYDLSQAPWFVRRHAVSYPGSAAMVAAARAQGARPRPDFDFLGVGDPELAGSRGPGPGRARAAELARLPPLPETAAELRASSQSFGRVRLLLRAEATEAVFRDELVGNYRFLSFATHGLIRDDIEGLEEPSLVLTAGASDDGLLTASEIADLNLSARFVALSACNTANYDLQRAVQDLPSLASAFAVAGAPATLATLWPVESITGARMTPQVFARLGGGAASDPATALAEAQRAFLAAPPGAAYLHPRFWAPFVILGDGDAPTRDARPLTAPALDRVERIEAGGGEVLALRQTPAGLAASYIGAADANGRYGAGVRVTAPNGREVWRKESRDLGASRVLTALGDALIAGGYTTGAPIAPVLERLDPAGAAQGRWQGSDPDGRDSLLLDAAGLPRHRAVLAIGQPIRRPTDTPAARHVRLLSVDAGLRPQILADIALPNGMTPARATVTPFGTDLLVSVSDDAAPAPAPESRVSEDDFDSDLCVTRPRARLEIRDGRTGALKAAREVEGYAFAASVTEGAGAILVGAHAAACLETRAAVVRIDAKLDLHPLFEDSALGRSELRAIAPVGDGRFLAVGNKESVFDAAAPALEGSAWRTPPGRAESGLILLLGEDGRPGTPLLLDSGAEVFLSAAAADGQGRAVIGGAAGGGAALLRLRLPPAVHAP